ncbi:MAG: molecular chaperone TorD family protein [Coriobacteriales bacterium]|nr:molecular chaperone TorD family protein [Coriobacteriales bacterium]
MAQDTTAIPAEQAQTQSDNAEMCALMRSRAAMYGFLSRLFIHEVDADFLAQLRSMAYPQNSDNPAINEGFRKLYSFMRHAREDVLSVLSVDYARTILGSGVLNGNAAFPYESVYTSEHALVMQEARDEVLAIYRANGMDKEAKWTDPEDHIALEFEFMRTLCERTAQALEDEGSGEYSPQELVATQYGFLMLHLLRWIPRFCIDVPRYASTDFYAAAAQLTDAFLADEKVLLEDIAEASGIDLEETLAEARAADERIDAIMEEAAAEDHEAPNIVVTTGEELDPSAKATE